MNIVKTNTKKSFWKFIYFPLWETEKKQKLIEEYAENGYILVKVVFLSFYKFQKSDPQKIKCYISTNEGTRGLSSRARFEEYWKTKKIVPMFGAYELIWDCDNHPKEFKKYYREMNLWRDYVVNPRNLFTRILSALFFLILSGLALIQEFDAMFALIFTLPSLAGLIYNVIGMVIVSKRYKNLTERPPDSTPLIRIDDRKNAMPKKKHKKKRYQYEK